MNKTLRVLAAALLAAGVAVPAAWAQQTPAEAKTLATYEKYAEPPVDHVVYFQIQGFQYLSPDTLAIRFGVNKLYLFTVQTPCINLAFTHAISMTARNNVVYRGLDAITFRNQRCKILKITPVNDLKMKQDETKAAAAKKAANG